MPRMEHVTVRLPSDLVDELYREGQAMGCGMSWAMRRRLEVPRETSLPQSRQTEGHEHHAGTALHRQEEALSSR